VGRTTVEEFIGQKINEILDRSDHSCFLYCKCVYLWLLWSRD